MAEINLEDAILEAYGRKVPVLSGEYFGELVRVHTGLEDLFKHQGKIDIKFPDWINTVQQSFLEGMMGRLIDIYGYETVIEKIVMLGKCFPYGAFFKAVLEHYIKNSL